MTTKGTLWITLVLSFLASPVSPDTCDQVFKHQLGDAKRIFKDGLLLIGGGQNLQEAEDKFVAARLKYGRQGASTVETRGWRRGSPAFLLVADQYKPDLWAILAVCTRTKRGDSACGRPEDLEELDLRIREAIEEWNEEVRGIAGGDCTWPLGTLKEALACEASREVKSFCAHHYETEDGRVRCLREICGAIRPG